MQIMIDTLADTPSALRLAAQFLIDHASLREALNAGAGLAVDVPTGTQQPPAPPAPPVPATSATAPAISTATPSSAPAVVPPPPPTLSIVPPPPAAMPPEAPEAPAVLPVTGSTAPVDEFYDDSGVPFDARIHQKSKNKKKDGTWKVQKGLDPAIVEAVMRELAPRIRRPGAAATPAQTPPPAGASAPVSLPPVPPPPGAIVPPPPPPLPPQAQAPITTPGAEATPGGPAVDPFRALVSKITNARREQKISPEEVTQCVTAAGAPSLQLLNNMPHLIPNVEAGIDAILAVR